MDLLSPWTGGRACVLQEAFRLSNDRFARKLGIGVRTVASWHQKPDLRPQSGIQQKLDKALDEAPTAVKQRFGQLADLAAPAPPNGTSAPETVRESAFDQTDSDRGHSGAATAEQGRLITDPNIGAALEWLDLHTGRRPGTSQRDVAARLTTLDIHGWRAKQNSRARVDQHRIMQALTTYYADRPTSHGTYNARYGSKGHAATSVLTCADWLDVDCPLGAEDDALIVTSTAPTTIQPLDEQIAEHAAQRLAATLAADARLVDMPLYRLMAADIRHGTIAGSLAVAPFVQYALTMDLLEGELVDAITAGVEPRPGFLPLRDSHLPDVAAVLDLSTRLCAGGALALCAIARPARPHHRADYLLLIQERSSHVLNATHRLAVIPKGFHQPLTDFHADARIGATLLREMEEELFGRDDIDNTISNRRRADPMHPSRLSEPMRWLLDDTDRLRIECTGFGLNLVSGNYEFPCLIVIDDDEFWSRYGGDVEANWESSSLRQYSSLDRDSLTALISDVGWSNEGLFALLQGLRRLAEVGGNRVSLPTIEWEIAQ